MGCPVIPLKSKDIKFSDSYYSLVTGIRQIRDWKEYSKKTVDKWDASLLILQYGQQKGMKYIIP